MRPEESPFLACWWGSSLEKAGLADVRARASTYGRYDFHLLPSVPFEPRGDFSWLLAEPERDFHIGSEKPDENVGALKSLKQSAQADGWALPMSLLTFMSSPELHARIRSNTDCFLDLCPAVIPAPVQGGGLIRFLADSQGCLFWYLYLTRAGDHAVVASDSFFGTKEEEWDDEGARSQDVAFVAESLEVFIWRFWLENEIWRAAHYDKVPVEQSGKAYIAEYRRKADALGAA
jgi:hypothetical protein